MLSFRCLCRCQLRDAGLQTVAEGFGLELSTLQKACIAATFNVNPAKCPAASVVGKAKVITPVLPVPLVCPAYFVSHGGEAFPSLTMVLQGYGVTIMLVGTTLIRKGITSKTFKSTPDVPFESFELNLPWGRFSALGAPEGLCGKKLAMPTVFTAQNGAVIKTSTPISVSGCRKHKAAGKGLQREAGSPAAPRRCTRPARIQGLHRASESHRTGIV
jgi:hypothetical protein